MANKDADKDKTKKAPKGDPEAIAKEKAKEEKAKAKAKEKEKAKKEADAATASEAPAEKPKEAPRQPADPRLKFIKKFHGKFLPRGPLRDRHKQLMERWNSGEEHGGVTADELKSLYTDWKAAREKPAKKAAV